MQTTGSNVVKTGNLDAAGYGIWVDKLKVYFDSVVGTETLFETNIEGEELWKIYLDSFQDPAERQYHNCNACKKFITHYGGLVIVADNGAIRPALWTPYTIAEAADHCPELVPALDVMSAALRKAQITRVFLSSESVYGVPVTGIWRHVHVNPVPQRIYKKNKLKDAYQAAAEKTEEYRTVSLFLSEYTTQQLDHAVEICSSDALYRGEKVLGQAQWLADLKHAVMETKNGTLMKNIIWKAVATAPAGYCHPRSSMINTLLEDLHSGMSVEEAGKRFADKMNPIKYQRPQAAPTAGNIARAEKIVEELGLAPSLERRFATEEDILAWVWRPESRSVLRRQAAMGGQPQPVFGHLVPKGERPDDIRRGIQETMTWVKFRDKTIDGVTRIQLKVPSGMRLFVTLVTAKNPDAPPILQWDREDARNPVSWYVWHFGSEAREYGLKAGSLVDVTGIILKPCFWTGANEHQGEGIIFALEGAADTKNHGNGLFPEILKTELREVRSTIEAYSRRAKVLPAPEGRVPIAGLGLFKFGASTNDKIHLEVTMKSGIVNPIILDRWD